MRVFVIFLFSFASAAKQFQPVINGNPVTSGFFHVVNIKTEDEIQICTGSIVAPDKILLAAHCVPELMPGEQSTYKVYVGTYQAIGGLEYGIRDVKRMGGYLPQTEGMDVEILYLQKNISFTNPDYPANIIIVSRAQVSPGESITAAGFGMDQTGAPSPQLMYANFAVVSREECPVKQTTDELCFLSSTQSLSGGDSGTAYLWNGKAVAIHVHSSRQAGTYNIGINLADDRVVKFLKENGIVPQN